MEKKMNAKDFEKQFGFMQDDGLGGFEQMTQDVIALPFLKVLQQLSPQLDSDKPEYIEGAKKGMFCNTSLNKVYEAPLEVVVGRFDRYFIEWKPNRGGFVSPHAPEAVLDLLQKGELIHNEKNHIVDRNNGNEFQETYVYYIILPDYMEDGLMLLSLSATQLKEGRKWNRNLLSMVIPGTNQKAKPWYMRWTLTTPIMQNDRGSWNGLKADFAGWVNEEQFALVTSERQALPATVNLDLTALESGTGSESGGEYVDAEYSAHPSGNDPF